MRSLARRSGPRDARDVRLASHDTRAAPSAVMTTAATARSGAVVPSDNRVECIPVKYVCAAVYSNVGYEFIVIPNKYMLVNNKQMLINK